jgi:hypothetical protein
MQVGTNLVTLKFGKKTCTVRELGGCMSPVWNSYHKDVKNLIVRFVQAIP